MKTMNESVDFVKDVISFDKEISRKFSLNNGVKSLQSVIRRLKNEGYLFEKVNIGDDLNYKMYRSGFTKEEKQFFMNDNRYSFDLELIDELSKLLIYSFSLRMNSQQRKGVIFKVLKSRQESFSSFSLSRKCFLIWRVLFKASEGGAWEMPTVSSTIAYLENRDASNYLESLNTSEVIYVSDDNEKRVLIENGFIHLPR